MQMLSNDENIDFVPYSFTDDFPFFEWNHMLHSPAVNNSRLHRHNCIEIGYCFKGSGVFVSGKKSLSFTAGDASLILTGVAHIASSNKSDTSIWHFVMVDINKLKKLFAKEKHNDFISFDEMAANIPHIIYAEENPRLCLIIKQILEESLNAADNYRAVIIGLSFAMLSMINQYELRQIPRGNEYYMNREYDMISPAIGYISNNHSEMITVGHLAKMCNMSESSFRRSFYRIIGTTPMEFIYETRIKLAVQMLKDQKTSINEISLAVGYESLSSFNRHFKKHTGLSPREFRKQGAAY